jgi:hypothetical protein
MALDHDPQSFREAYSAIKPDWYGWPSIIVPCTAWLVLLYASVGGQVSTKALWAALVALAAFMVVETAFVVMAYLAYWGADS